MIEKMFGQVDVMKKGLDGLWLRNQVVTDNIANSETEGYKTKEVKVEKSFRDALFSLQNAEKSLEKVKEMKFSVSEKRGQKIKSNGNNVDIDYEMTELAKNQIMYNAMVKKISRELSRIKYVIDEGGR